MSALTRNILFYTLLGIWTLAIPLGVAPFFVLCALFRGESLRIALRRANHFYGRGWRYCISPWVTVQEEGFALEAMPRPCLVVANHQSFFDIHCASALPNGNAILTARDWPFRMPLYGFFMRMAGYINLEKLSHEALVERIRRDADEGAAIVFFPEGHRSPGNTIQRFHAGAFALALASNLPVVPLCIKGSGAVLPPGSPWIHPGNIRVKALPPVYPDAFRAAGDNAPRLMRKQVLETMRAAMLTL